MMLQSAYPEYMQHFLGRPGAKEVLGLGRLSDRAATLAVWGTLQFELAFALPLYAVSAHVLTLLVPRPEIHNLTRTSVTATLAAWGTLQLELASALPLYTVVFYPMGSLYPIYLKHWSRTGAPQRPRRDAGGVGDAAV